MVDLAIPSKPTLQVELPLHEVFCWFSLSKRDDLDILAVPSPIGPTANTAMLAQPGNEDVIFKSLSFF